MKFTKHHPNINPENSEYIYFIETNWNDAYWDVCK